MELQSIHTPNAPMPAGHYSQAIVHNGLVYVAGQLPIDPATGEKRLGSIEEETESVMRNVEAILIAAGSGLDRVLQMTVYLADNDLWDGFNKTYARLMGGHRPARAAVPVGTLHYGFKIEVTCIAALRD